MTDHDVIVIGSGPVGLACAIELADRGVDVAVVEAETVGSGAARRNAGWVSPALAAPVPAPGVVGSALRWMRDPTSPLRVAPSLDPGHVAFMTGMLRASTPRRFAAGTLAVNRLAEGTLDRFLAYRERGVDVELHRAGMLMAFTSRDGLDAHIGEFAHVTEYGMQAPTTLDAADVHALEPALSDIVVAGLLAPDQLHLDPVELSAAMHRAVSARGVPIVESSPVHRVDRASSRVVVPTSDGPRTARQVVVAAGVGSARIARSAGQPIPLRFGKGYGFDLPMPSVPLRHAVYLSDARVAVSPLARGLRLAGTMELGGDPDRVDRRRAGAIMTSAQRYLVPDLGPTLTPWMGLRPMTPDGLPVIGRLDTAPEIVMATGHAMLGVTLAPRTGELVADVLAGAEPDVLVPFSPARFSRSRRSWRSAQARTHH